MGYMYRSRIGEIHLMTPFLLLRRHLMTPFLLLRRVLWR